MPTTVKTSTLIYSDKVSKQTSFDQMRIEKKLFYTKLCFEIPRDINFKLLGMLRAQTKQRKNTSKDCMKYEAIYDCPHKLNHMNK